MADSGKNAAFTFNGTVYNADDCLQGWDLADSVNDVVYQCNGYDKHASGTRSIMFRTALALAATDTTKVGALAPATTGTFEAHPGGDTKDYIEIRATASRVVRRDLSAPINGIITADVEISLDDITFAAATT